MMTARKAVVAAPIGRRRGFEERFERLRVWRMAIVRGRVLERLKRFT